MEEFNEFMTEHPREYLLQEFILQSVLVGVFRMRFFSSLEVVGEEDFAAASCDLSYFVNKYATDLLSIYRAGTCSPSEEENYVTILFGVLCPPVQWWVADCLSRIFSFSQTI